LTWVLSHIELQERRKGSTSILGSHSSNIFSTINEEDYQAKHVAENEKEGQGLFLRLYWVGWIVKAVAKFWNVQPGFSAPQVVHRLSIPRLLCQTDRTLDSLQKPGFCWLSDLRGGIHEVHRGADSSMRQTFPDSLIGEWQGWVVKGGEALPRTFAVGLT